MPRLRTPTPGTTMAVGSRVQVRRSVPPQRGRIVGFDKIHGEILWRVEMESGVLLSYHPGALELILPWNE